MSGLTDEQYKIFDQDLFKREIIFFLNQLSDDERQWIFNRYCVECGSTNPKCRCWDDS